MPKRRSFDANMVMNTGPRHVNSGSSAADKIMQQWDTYMEADGTTAFTITLPKVTEAANQIYTIYLNMSGVVLTITDNGDDAQFTDDLLKTQYDYWAAVSTGKHWVVLADNATT